MKKLKPQDYGSKSNDEDRQGLPAVVRGAAGIDLGSEVHWVCAPTKDEAGREVARFGATTPELEKMAAWMKERKVESVALESTGVYWIAPHEVVERHGFQLVLVNTRELARRRHRDGHNSRHRERRAGRPETGAITQRTMP